MKSVGLAGVGARTGVAKIPQSPTGQSQRPAFNDISSRIDRILELA